MHYRSSSRSDGPDDLSELPYHRYISTVLRPAENNIRDTTQSRFEESVRIKMAGDHQKSSPDLPGTKCCKLYCLEVDDTGKLIERDFYSYGAKKYDDKVYESLEIVRDRYKKAERSTVFVCEDLIPIAMEVLGLSLGLGPRVFQLHVAESWRDRTRQVVSAPCSYSPSDVTITEDGLIASIQAPRILQSVAPPPTKGLQHGELSAHLFRFDPLLDFSSRTYEHLSFQLLRQNNDRWTGKVTSSTFPNTFTFVRS
jgi:hypothetical protein